MPEHKLEKLLGGFAADTLTPQERETLFRAALQDQQLFNALADEQALKELLADPVVRGRLLRALDRQGRQRSKSWWNRFTTPSGLTWAGGVAVGVFAVVLGLTVYEDSLRQTSDTATVEERKPSAPPAAPPVQAPPADREIAGPRSAPPTPEAATQDRVALKPRSARAKAAESDKRPQLPKEERTDEAPAPSTLAEEPTALRERPAPPASPSSASSPQPLREMAGAAPGISARALFYGEDSPGPAASLRELQKHEQPPAAPERFGLQKNLDRAEPVKPLAFRYRIIKESAAETSRAVRLTVESNQDAYLQIWRRSGESLPELVLPAKDTGRISMKTANGQRQQITVEEETDRLIVRLSRVPFGPITRQEAVMAGRGARGQVTESVSGTEEPASYVANPDPSATELAVDIAVGARTTR